MAGSDHIKLNNIALPMNSRLEKIKFWTDSWNCALKKNADHNLPVGTDAVRRWDIMAKQLDRLSESDRIKSRINRTVTMLVENNIDLKGLKILDIGAGAGDLTLAFALRGARVTAIEPSPAMAGLIEKKIKEHDLSEVKIISELWEDIAPGKHFSANCYDLVLASLNPGVRSIEAVTKMIDSSRSWCLLCDIAAGSKPSSGRQKMWQELFKERMPENYYDVGYPLNYLYCSGYDLQFQDWSEVWGEKQPVEEALIDFLNYFSIYTEITDEIRETIEVFLNNNSKQGSYTDFHPVKLGMILWKKSSRAG